MPESSPHAGLDLDSSQPVFVRIVAIRHLEWQRAVAVALPAAAKIDGVVDPADLVITADAQCDGVILAVADIRKSDEPQNRSVECARRTEAVDAQRIVAAVLAAPFAMVDKTGRNLLQ